MLIGTRSSRTTAVDTTREDTIQAGCTLLLRLPSGDVKTWKLEKDSTANLGKFGSFYANELIGQPFGLTYDIIDKRLKAVPPSTLQEVEDTDATNELINDGQFVQPLTSEEIEALKKAGLHASEIIKKQIEQHANYELKTEYSKEKYKKRKEAKYSKSFTVLDPTIFNVCEYWFNKDQNRLRDVRSDALSQMLNMANIRPGGRYLAVDDASGVIVAGVLERMGGIGRLITICDVDSPPAYPVMVHMNFKKEVVQVMSSLNWATADEDYTPILAPSEPPTGKFKSDAQKSRLNKRKVVSDSLMQAREDLFAGEFEALVVASEYDPFSMLERLSPYLAGSASIVVHSPHIQIVADLQSKLRDRPQYLGPTVTEPWMRRYQVLPGRTHPLMNMSGSGGFILHTTKMRVIPYFYDDPAASSIVAHRHKPKRAKLDGDTTETASSTANTTAASTPAPVVEDQGENRTDR
ncbi:Gcd10p-domain-containing protein [Laetiporus sulphureus 93-53]|uniref:tRNA (adenine(58)-N(1))-methyltransferase non-catalytic subunit TRM6 n=1 Tax=Laetiporus sulphureus 93-53 TaxID=1314785 RepID=A0A165FB36_9APHY|nr:Gcd10p-domain-containing protein [Laetiporus sulphureus 93-53]KZT08696.1 Gcd10p-domain-containing protein [Laetiporus sulphureus 93-53]